MGTLILVFIIGVLVGGAAREADLKADGRLDQDDKVLFEDNDDK